MDLTGGQALSDVFAIAILKAATVEHIVVEGRGQEITVVAITVAGEKIVLVANRVVNADVEFVLRLTPFGIGKESLGAELSGIGAGNKFGQFRAERIDAAVGATGLVNLLAGSGYVRAE